MFLWILLIVAVLQSVFGEDLNIEPFTSSPEEIVALTSRQEELIGGMVHPLSGQLVLKKDDLVARGAQEIVLSRRFIAPVISPITPQGNDWEQYEQRKNFAFSLKKYRGWVYLPHLWMQVEGSRVRLSEPNGVLLEFSLSENGSVLLTKPHGISPKTR